MASCITSQWVSYSPQAKLTVTQSSSTATTVTFSWTLQYIADYPASSSGGRAYSVIIDGKTVKEGLYDINGITGTRTVASGTTTVNKTTSSRSVAFSLSFHFALTWSGVYGGTKTASGSISIGAKASYTVSYNANGGSGAPSSQTKWHGTTLTLSSTKPTRTGYTFQGWATSSGGGVTYSSGASYTANSGVTLYAVWKAITYTVSYNANGGSGAPSSQTKTYGVVLKLSSTKPSRTNYTFKGWGTSASSTTVAYSAGGSYSQNANITLYAVWELSYVKPRITAFSLDRCTSEGVLDDVGTCALIRFNWSCDRTVSSITVRWEDSFGGTGSTALSASGTSGTIRQVIGSNSLSTERSYAFILTVTDSNGYVTRNGLLNGTTFPIDVYNNGNGIAFGKPAELEGIADFGFEVKFNSNVYGTVFGLWKLERIPEGADINNYVDPGGYAVQANTTAQTVLNLPTPVVGQAGRLFVADSTGQGNSEGYLYRRQTYHPYKIGLGIFERDIVRTSDGVWSYGGWYKYTLTAV